MTILRILNRSMQRHAEIAMVLVGVLMLAAGFWPFDFNPPNGAVWIGERNGIVFPAIEGIPRPAGGLVHTPQTMKRSEPDPGVAPGLTLEISLSPGERPPFSRAHILALCDGNYEDRFVIAQWKTHLLLRWIENGPTGVPRWREIGLRDALISKAERLITISSGEAGTTLYLDGEIVRHASGLQLPTTDGDLYGMHLLLGNSWQVNNAWSGQIYGLALYGILRDGGQVMENLRRWSEDPRSIDRERIVALYLFHEKAGERVEDSSGNGNHLSLSDRLPFRKPALAPWNLRERLTVSEVKDMLVNLLGFIPAGFFFMLWFEGRRRKPVAPWRYALGTALAGLILSLTIEIVQVLLPTRNSCVRDVVFNTAGATIGWWLWRLMDQKEGSHVRSVEAVGGAVARRP